MARSKKTSATADSPETIEVIDADPSVVDAAGAPAKRKRLITLPFRLVAGVVRLLLLPVRAGIALTRQIVRWASDLVYAIWRGVAATIGAGIAVIVAVIKGIARLLGGTVKVSGKAVGGTAKLSGKAVGGTAKLSGKAVVGAFRLGRRSGKRAAAADATDLSA